MPDIATATRPPTSSRLAPASEGRSLRRRPNLPNGRAVVGGFLVALSALGIFVAYVRATDAPSTSFVIARRDVPVGTTLTADDLDRLTMTLPEGLASRSAFRTEEALIGATTVGPVRRGELVQAGDVVRKRSGPAELELSFAIERPRAVSGSLRAGERVDVLATFGAGGDVYTVVAVRQARVLESTPSNGSLAASDTDVIRLAVASADEALALTHAVNAGEVTLVRATGASVSGAVGQTYRAPSAGSVPPATASGGR